MMVIDDKYAMLILTALESYEKRLNQVFREPMTPQEAEHFENQIANIYDLGRLIRPIICKQVNWKNVNAVFAELGCGSVTFHPDGNVTTPKLDK